MSKKRRQDSASCSIESKRGKLRLRWYVRTVDGRLVHPAFPTGLADTPENRHQLNPLREVVGKLVQAGKDPTPHLKLAQLVPAPTDVSPVPAPSLGPTVRSHYPVWFAAQAPLVRRANARDYERHFKGYVFDYPFADIPLAALTPRDARALQAELLARKQVLRDDGDGPAKPLSVKTVKNIINGSLRAFWRDVMVDELVTRDIFAGLTWPAWDHPEPDPFTAEEMRRILGWFRSHHFGFPPLSGSMGVRRLPHPPFHAYAQILFTAGLRPSEASGLQQQDVDLTRGLLYVRRSYHLHGYNAPKTRSARRTVEMLPETVRVLRALQPLHVAPELPVFTSTTSGPIEPKSFSEHWYRCLRALNLRVRGLYTTKDTFVSIALRVRGPRWVEKQTGVAYATLAKHYAKWMPDDEDRDELSRLARAFNAPSRDEKGSILSPTESAAGDSEIEVREKWDDSGCEEGDLNPHGCYPTSPSN
jgi:integrase